MSSVMLMVIGLKDRSVLGKNPARATGIERAPQTAMRSGL